MPSYWCMKVQKSAEVKNVGLHMYEMVSHHALTTSTVTVASNETTDLFYRPRMNVGIGVISGVARFFTPGMKNNNGSPWKK